MTGVQRRLIRFWTRAASVAAALALSLGHGAWGSLTVPNGNPTGANSATGPNGTATLNPSPGVYIPQVIVPGCFPG